MRGRDGGSICRGSEGVGRGEEEGREGGLGWAGAGRHVKQAACRPMGGLHLKVDRLPARAGVGSGAVEDQAPKLHVRPSQSPGPQIAYTTGFKQKTPLVTVANGC